MCLLSVPSLSAVSPVVGTQRPDVTHMHGGAALAERPFTAACHSQFPAALSDRGDQSDVALATYLSLSI